MSINMVPALYSGGVCDDLQDRTSGYLRTQRLLTAAHRWKYLVQANALMALMIKRVRALRDPINCTNEYLTNIAAPSAVNEH